MQLFFEHNKSTEDFLCGFVSKIKNLLVVAFHGTRFTEYPVHDWIVNGKIFGDDGGYKNSIAPHSINFGVHPGFSTVVMSCYENVCKILRRHSFVRLVFTGHSMGAAIAQLFALKYCVEAKISAPQAIVNVFAFSSPMVFSEYAAKMYNEVIGDLSSVHIYVNTDVVTYVPFMCNVGIQAPISVQNREEGIAGSIVSFVAWLFPQQSNSELKFAKKTVGTIAGLYAIYKFHTLNFTSEEIYEIIERIRKNYLEDQYMGPGLLGRKR